MRVSINSGLTMLRLEDISDDDLTKHYRALTNAMDFDARDAANRQMEHDSWEDVEGEPEQPADELRRFLKHYLEKAPHDLVIGTWNMMIKKTTTVTTRYERTVTVAEILHALGAPVDARLSIASRYEREFGSNDTLELTWETVEESAEINPSIVSAL